MDYPELSKFIKEMPNTISVSDNEATNSKTIEK